MARAARRPVYGAERFFRPGYLANLTTWWIPALEGAEDKLRRGAKVADVGCGHGASTIIMARAYPESAFVGFDYHSPRSMRLGRPPPTPASTTGSASRWRRRRTTPGRIRPGRVLRLPARHGRPHRRGTARPGLSAADGTWLIVEPFANDATADNLNPIGRVFYWYPPGLHPGVAVTGGRCRPRRPGRREHACRDVVTAAGFTRFRRASETPFNLVFEARP